MSVYRLSVDANQYMEFDIPPTELRSKMGDEIRIHMGAGLAEYKDTWVAPNGVFYNESDYYPDAIKIPDLTIWAKHLVLNEKAYNLLKPLLADLGELLPVNCEGFTYYIFNLLTTAEMFDGLDDKKCEFNMLDGHQTDLKSISFHESKLENTLLFKSDYDYKVRLYCNEKFKKMITDEKLTGLIFNTDLSGFINKSI